MKTKIPETTVVTCDFCGKTNEQKGLFRTDAHIQIQRNALDYQGCAVANGGASLDLCDSCCYRVEEMIQALAKQMKPAP